ncbi:MAG: EAL domain-containing protein [Gammaproteobacteria bacterium]|nr:EAL domain-containing protein [Gammaproteobacteria bacterium]
MSYQQRTNSGEGRYLQAAGFTAILVLMTLLTLLGLQKMANINQHLKLIVNQHNVKSALVKQMSLNARERVFTIQNMILTDDPFAQDEAALSIDELGANFAAARQQLMGMPLEPHERMLIDIQSKWVQQAVPLQREAVILIVAGNHEQAKRLLMEQVLPTQHKVLATLSQLEAQQDAAISRSFSQAITTHNQARVQIIILGGLAAILGILIALFTIHRSRLSSRQLLREKERAQVTLHSIGDGVITADANGSIEYMNPVAEQLTGWHNHAAEGKALLDVFRVTGGGGGNEAQPLYCKLEQLFAQDGYSGTLHQSMLLDADHNTTAIEFTASAIHDDEGQLAGIVVTFRDVSEIRALADHLSHQARHDPLTNLVNRREFELRLEQALVQARQERQQHALCFLDLDRFKIVNDTCGHAAGDALLIQLVSRLKTLVRSNDLLARLGGDEFGLLLVNCPLEKASAIAEELRSSVHSFVFVWEKQSFNIGVSIGMVVIDANSGTLSEVIAMADAACYSAKDGGRNRVHLYTNIAENRHTEQKMPWSERLQTALQDDNFTLYCQSIVAINPLREQLHLCELQLRFKDEQGQSIPPMAFIPAAERHNLMPAIDRWVLRHACQLIRLIDDPTAIYCINLSLQTVNDEQFLPAVKQLLQSHHVEPQQICFEITESYAISDLQKIGDFVRQLREMGCRSALDDVGRSIGSYDYLKNLPVDFIKIDGHLIGAVVHSTISSVQVKAITQIAHLLGICVIAEMVEDHHTLQLLGGLGINYAQGFGIAKPRPIAELREALAVSAVTSSTKKG